MPDSLHDAPKGEDVADTTPAEWSMSQLLALAFSRWWLLLGTVVIALAAVLIYVSSTRPVFTASGTLQLLGVQEGHQFYQEFASLSRPANTSAEAQVLQSSPVIDDAFGEDDGKRSVDVSVYDPGRYAPLTHWDPEHDGFGRSPRLLVVPVNEWRPSSEVECSAEFLDSRRVRLTGVGALGAEESLDVEVDPGEPVQVGSLQLAFWPQGDLSGEKFKLTITPRALSLARFRRELEVGEAGRGTGIIRVRFNSSDPHHAASVVNGLMDSYVKYREDEASGVAEQAVEFLSNEAERLEGEWESAAEELERFRDEHDASYLEESAIILFEQLRAYRLLFARVGLEADLYRRLANDEEGMKRPETLHAWSENDAFLFTLASRIVEKGLDSDRALMRETIVQHAESMAAQEDALQTAIDGFEERVDALPFVIRRAEQLERRVAGQEEALAEIELRLTKARAAQAAPVEFGKVLEAAVPPHARVRPHVTLLLLAAVLAGLVAGCLLSILVGVARPEQPTPRTQPPDGESSR